MNASALRKMPWLLLLLLPFGAHAKNGSQAPVSMSEGSSQVVALSAGANHSCGLRADGSAICWGRNGEGQVLPSSLTDAAKLAGPFISVATGDRHSCGLRPTGVAVCWGSDSHGQVSGVPMPNLLNGPFVELSGGSDFTCGRKSDGTLTCWGNYENTLPPGAGRQFIDVAAGALHGCGLMANGDAYCWGGNSTGAAPSYTSSAPSVAGPFITLAAGNAFTCGLRANAELQCWGSGLTATPPAGSFIALAAGSSHACALSANGSAQCWGDSAHGKTSPPMPDVPFVSLTAGQNHSCGLKADAAVACWGDSTEQQTTVPAELGEPAFGQIAAGNAHVCQVLRDGTLSCWGRNNDAQATPPGGLYTQVAVGDTLSCAIRAADAGITCWGVDAAAVMAAFADKGWRQISLGQQDGGLCALPLANDLVRCRKGTTVTNRPGKRANQADAPLRTITYMAYSPGNAFCGSLAVGTTDSASTYSTGYCTPGLSYPGGRWQSVEGGLWHGCAVQTNGVLQCFAGLSAQISIPSPQNTQRFRAVSAGTSHTCAIRDNGTLFCWGDNTNGKSNAPAGTYVQIAAGNTFTCAIRSDGVRVCWGDNAAGQAPQLQLQPASIAANASIGVAYPATTFTLSLVNGGSYAIPAPAFAVVTGGLPPGLSLDAATGVLSGTPTAAGNFSFTIEGEDANGFAARGSYSIDIVDLTPPLITYTLNGQAGPPQPDADGENGWYVSDVALAWSVIDDESAVVIDEGCLDATLNSDTDNAGVTYTCSAHSAGGSAGTVEVIIKRDATAPTASVSASPAANAYGWHNADVTVFVQCFDPTPGSGLLTETCPSVPDVTSEGVVDIAVFEVADNAGNASESNALTVKLDKTAPTIVAAATSTPNGNGDWYRSDVSVQFACADGLSGVATCPASQTLSSDGESVSSTAQSATDKAGNISNPSNIVTVKLDKTAPTITPILPNPILRGQNYTANPNASDETSGVASSSCGALDTSTLGDKSTICSATDDAGNINTVTLNYTVTSTCVNDGYKGTQLTWCKNICENGLTGATLDSWIHRWVNKYRDLPYCQLEPQQQPQ